MKHYQSAILLGVNADDIQSATTFMKKMSENLAKEMEVTSAIVHYIQQVKDDETFIPNKDLFF